MAPKHKLAHDGLFWRRLARMGATYGPKWWLKYTPPLFGYAAALAVPSARKNVVDNLRRIRGHSSPIEDVTDTARVFANYASCLAEMLSSGSKNSRLPEAVRVGEQFLHEAAAEEKGIVVVTVHSAGWDIAGQFFQLRRGLDMMLVMEAERDQEAQALNDQARRALGLKVAHVGGDDPLASLPVLHHLRDGGIVALQLDRLPEGMRRRHVRLLGKEGALPEGPFRIAQITGSPILPVFCARIGHFKYLIEAHKPLHVPRRATDAELDAVAQKVADSMTTFLRVHPTQWFNFGKIP
ncbi:MAG TPA: lysophospholipid acyltransferase family protein [Polyangiaceae bacterium]